MSLTAKLTPEAKKRAAARQKAAFDAARARGHRYFYFLGDWYNTKKKGESDAYWASRFKDNTTGAGANNVLTNVGGYWKGKKGTNGTYDSKGKWITFTNNGNAGPVLARGDHYNDHRGYINADLPTDRIVTKSGTNRRKLTTNTRTGVTVGNRILLTDAEKLNYPKRNPAPTERNMNWDTADFVDAIMPTNLIGNAMNAASSYMNGEDYHPHIDRSGFNPFGYAKDMANGDALGLASRGFDAYATLGAPGLSKAVDAMGVKLAPKMVQASSKSRYIPKTLLVEGQPNAFRVQSLVGKKASKLFGSYSIRAARKAGNWMPGNTYRWGLNVLLNTNTGTAYAFRGSSLPLYSTVADYATSFAPLGVYATNIAVNNPYSYDE